MEIAKFLAIPNSARKRASTMGTCSIIVPMTSTSWFVAFQIRGFADADWAHPVWIDMVLI